MCQAWKVTGGAGIGDVSSMDADETYVVWVYNGDVRQIKASGGPGEPVINVTFDASFFSEVSVVLRSGVVAFVRNVGPPLGVYTVPEGQISPSFQTSIPYTTYTLDQHLALNPSATNAFFVGHANAAPQQFYLLNCPLSGAGCAPAGGPIADVTTQVSAPLVTATDAFWVESITNPPASSIGRYTFVTNTMTTLPTVAVSSFTMDGSNVYLQGSDNVIYSVPQSFTTSTMPQIVAKISASDTIAALAADGVNVYIGSSSSAGGATLRYAPIGGGSPLILYTSPNMSGASEGPVVATGSAIYWTDADTSALPTLKWNIMGIAAP
jgi:hypothetical protein